MSTPLDTCNPCGTHCSTYFSLGCMTLPPKDGHFSGSRQMPTREEPDLACHDMHRLAIVYNLKAHAKHPNCMYELCRVEATYEMKCSPGKGHGKGLNGNWIEVQDARVQIYGRQRSTGDHHCLKLLEHWPHRQAGIQAAQLQCKYNVLIGQCSCKGNPWFQMLIADRWQCL